MLLTLTIIRLVALLLRGSHVQEPEICTIDIYRYQYEVGK